MSLDLRRYLADSYAPELSDREVEDAIYGVPTHYTDLSITAGNVAWVSGTPPRTVKAGASITAGQTVYLNTATNEYELADSNATAGIINYPQAIALTAGTDGGYMMIAEPDAVINIGGTVAKATPYFQSETPGGIQPLADMGAGEVVVLVCMGVTTANVLILCKPIGFTF